MATELPDYMQRVADEKAALDEKIAKLDAFLTGIGAVKTPLADLALLSRQHRVMQEYSNILGIRLEPYQKESKSA